MPTSVTTPVPTIAEFPGPSDRRHGSRTPAVFSLLYSGMDNGQEIALFVDLPGMGEPAVHRSEPGLLVTGRRFGVDLGTLQLEKKNPPGFFLWDRVGPLDNDRWI